ncbi:succinic semialdehyde dehydrogenase [Methylocapsa palsarum]|uniref:Succinate-semialdehyde dehydrogenase / glutarate-semialdehyde dehydrogenase n=1 Tax=Methylocapsa palsarum TaxID=1612308 RepID=A0A1I3YD97_9HYPH|nr:succinic semialdehyde dehydrogenase [Methylocapsa palsarum]SFK29917.1 succinate-semialdehyde dehydrogenase / glutarate-semialdehyde dehydrogenase [Methylocapsa palsarum]
MAEPACPQDTPDDGRLSARVSRNFLDRLSRRVVTVEPRDDLVISMPFTSASLGSVPHCRQEDVVAAAKRARAAGAAWSAAPAAKRAEVLLRFHDAVLARQDEVLDLIQLENGKARRHAYEEILDTCLVARYYAHAAPRLLRPQRRQGAIPLLTKTFEHRHPKGLAAIISPWNYPLTLGVGDALPALMAGNAVLAKPDERTPYSALWAAELLEEAGLPHGVLQVVTGFGAELGGAIIEASDFVMFTGSTAVGRSVAKQAGERLIDYSMELGGKNALLVLADADLERAVPGAARAAFSNSGQLCVSIERIYVDDALWDAFVPRFVAAAQGMKLSASLDYDADMGSLTSAKQLDTITRHVDDALAKGAKVIAGGRHRPDLGPYFYEPTILTGVRPGMILYAEETFGPVVSLYRTNGVEEAIARANDSPYGLNFSVWTRNARKGREAASRLEAGTVNVNEAYAAAWGSTDAPMGGFKASGVGRRHGAHGLLKYTDAQTIAIQRLLPLAPPSFMSAAQYARVMNAGLKVLRRLPGYK